MRWRNERRKNGEEGLRPKPAAGRPAQLTVQQKRRLVSHLLKGAMANGYRTELGTTARIAELIELHFGITYHRDHIGRLMASVDFHFI